MLLYPATCANKMLSESQNGLEILTDICRESERGSGEESLCQPSASPPYSPHFFAEVKAGCDHFFLQQLKPMGPNGLLN